ncbi:MAG: FHA domain-containing protein [Myxococcota bacterium]
MRIDIVWNEETTQVDLVDGVVTVGGATTDGICIAGLPHGLLSLELDGGVLKVTAIRSVRIGEALFPARVPRLLIEGEDLKLPNDVIIRRTPDAKKRESRKTIGTAFVAQELLSGDLAPQDTRAATLTCVTGLDQGRIFPIPFEENFIGRADDAAIRVRDRAVSRKHARLLRRGREHVLQIVPSSMNGIYVNGLLLKKDRVLKTGDVIEIGQTVLRFDDAERAPEECTRIVSPEEKAAASSKRATPAQPTPAQPAPTPTIAAEPVTAPKAAEPQLELVPPPPAEPGVAAAPPARLDGRRRWSLEVILMSAGIVLTLLGVGVVAALLL